MNGHTSEQVPRKVIQMLQSTVDFPSEHIEFSLRGQKFSMIISRDDNEFDCWLTTCVGDISYSREFTSSDEFDEALRALTKVYDSKQK